MESLVRSLETELVIPPVPTENPNLMKAYLFAEDLVGFAMDKAGLPWQRPFQFNHMRAQLVTIFTPNVGEAVWLYGSHLNLRIRPTFLEFCWQTASEPKLSMDAVAHCLRYFAILYLKRRRNTMDFICFCALFVKICLCFRRTGHLHFIRIAIKSVGYYLNEMQLWKVHGRFHMYDEFAKQLVAAHFPEYGSYATQHS